MSTYYLESQGELLMVHSHRGLSISPGVQNDSGEDTEVLTAKGSLSFLFKVEPVTQSDPGFLCRRDA